MRLGKGGSFPLDELAWQMTVLPFGWWRGSQSRLMQEWKGKGIHGKSWVNPGRGGFTRCAAGCQICRYKSENAVESLYRFQFAYAPFYDECVYWRVEGIFLTKKIDFEVLHSYGIICFS